MKRQTHRLRPNREVVTKRQGQRGLSLIEVIIAVGLTAGISAVLAPIVQTSVKASVRVDEAVQAADELDRARFALETLFEQIIIPSDNPKWNLNGKANRVSLTTVSSSSNSPKRIVLDISETENGLSGLLLKDADGGASPVHLIDLASVRWSYLAKGKKGKRQSSWKKTGLPALIELSGEAVDGTPFLMAFAPRVTGPHACAFDPVSRRCRQ